MKTLTTRVTLVMALLALPTAFPPSASAEVPDCSEYAAMLPEFFTPGSMRAAENDDFLEVLTGLIETCEAQPPATVDNTGDRTSVGVNANAVTGPMECGVGIAHTEIEAIVKTTLIMPGMNKAFDENLRAAAVVHALGGEFPTQFIAANEPTPGSAVNLFGLNAGGPQGVLYVSAAELAADEHEAGAFCGGDGKPCGGWGWAEISRKISETEIFYLHVEGSFACT